MMKFLFFTIIYYIVIVLPFIYGSDIPRNSRIDIVLKEAFWNYSIPDRKGKVFIRLVKKDGIYEPLISVDAERAGNCAHFGYVIETNEGKENEILLRVYFQRDLWTDIIGHAAYRLKFHVNGNFCSGVWYGIVHGIISSNDLSGNIEVMEVYPSSNKGIFGHPCFLLHKSDITELRNKIETDYGKSILKELEKDNDILSKAFLYLIKGEDSIANEVKERLERSLYNYDWHHTGGFQHGPAFRAIKYIMAFDMIYEKCSAEFKKRFFDYLRDKKELFYWGCYNSQFNAYDTSNWSMIYRSAAGMIAMLLLEDGKFNTFPCYNCKGIINVASPSDIKDDDMDLFAKPDIEKPVDKWIYLGPFEEEVFSNNVKNVRLYAGFKVKDITARLLQENELTNGCVKLRKIRTGRSERIHYFYSILNIEQPVFVRIESLARPKGVRLVDVYISGEKFDIRDCLYLSKGKHPLLVRLFDEPVGGWEPHDFWLRIRPITEEDADIYNKTRLASYDADKFCGDGWEEKVIKNLNGKNIEAYRYLKMCQLEVEGYLVKGLGDFGWNLEGEAYTRHSIRAGAVFAHCFRKFFGYDLKGTERIGKMLALCTAFTVFTDENALMQSFNVGGGPMDLDIFVYGFEFVPENLKTAVLWSWNKSHELATKGKLADPHGIVSKYDNIANILRLLYFPYDFSFKDIDPADSLGYVVIDNQKGGIVFRNQYKDENDIVVQVFANSNNLGGSWTSCEGGTFRITGLGQYWVFRGQSYGNGASGRSLLDYSLYQNMVDIEGHNLGGGPQAWIKEINITSNGSGYVVLDMNEVYCNYDKNTRTRNDIGIKATRRIDVDFSGKDGTAAIVRVIDDIKNTPLGTNIWQITFLRDKEIEVKDNIFIVKGKNGAVLTGRVHEPSDVVISVIDNEHVHEINYHGEHAHKKFYCRSILVKAISYDVRFNIELKLRKSI